MTAIRNQVALIQSNIEVHGLEWAAQKQREAMKKNPQGCNSFDTFYFAVFGKWPTRKEVKKV